MEAAGSKPVQAVAVSLAMDTVSKQHHCLLAQGDTASLGVLMHVQATSEPGPLQTQAASPDAQPGDQSAVQVAASNTAQGSAPGQAQSAPQPQASATTNQQTSSSSARAAEPDQANNGDAVPLSAAMPVPDQATTGDSEPDLAAAEALSPESAVVSPARLQDPDQAVPGLSAFQRRLHSMLPQLPTMEKLAQLSQEVCTADCAVTAAMLLIPSTCLLHVNPELPPMSVSLPCSVAISAGHAGLLCLCFSCCIACVH